MAFDMYVDGLRESIGHHEEYFFALIANDDKFPLLNSIREKLYDDPRIPSNEANGLAHECIRLKSTLDKMESPELDHILDRLIRFFSEAYSGNQEIRCVSD